MAPTNYKRIRIEPGELESEAYKRHLGGGKEQWDRRGRFQVLFLKAMGTPPSARLLDIGCGPLRAGVHLIDYLDPGNYIGFDYNVDFIMAAEAIIEKQSLTSKQPEVTCISDFDCSGRNWSADVGLAFSVLNHCSEQQKKLFFQRIPQVLRPGARLYVTHASWMRPAYLTSSGLKVTRTIGSTFMDITLHGWGHRDDIFPIIELTKEAPNQ